MKIKLKIKDALSKIVHKATLRTYEQNETSKYMLVDEGYSSDLRHNSIFKDCEVEHITYDDYRKRPCLTITKEEIKKAINNTSFEDIRNYLRYHRGIDASKVDNDNIKDVAYECAIKWSDD